MSWLFMGLAVAALAGCASTGVRNRQAASVVEYLYPASQPPQPTEAIARLKLPARVGIAFAPAGRFGVRLSAAERTAMLERVKASFADRPFISAIEVIPDAYLRPTGGFENLDQMARMFRVDIVCLLSYDQVQYAEDNMASILYWTIVGAYVIPATKFSTHTMLDAAVFDVQSRRLLFRAPGVSELAGHRARAASAEFSRVSLQDGFEQALGRMIPALHDELDRFKERVKNDATVQVEHRPGSRTGGSMDAWGLFLLLGLAGVYARRR
jgi:rhombotail lipoprotein